MPNTNVGPNQNPILYARNTAGGTATYVTATNNKLDVNATASLAGVAIPISGATTAVGVAIVDGSGNQITSFGGGTQYTDAGTPPAHPVAPTLEWNNAGTWATVGSAAPLPVTANAGTNLNTSLLATSANLTAGSMKTQIVDGSGNVGSMTSNAQDVNLKTSSITLNTAVTSISAGTNIIGKVSIDQTTPGTTNNVSVSQMGAAAAMADGASNPTLGGAQAYSMGYNGATWERLRVDLGDASSPTGVLVNNPLLYNGSTYDRARGDTTSGLWVNVKNTSIAVTNTGTFAVQSSLAAPTTIFNGKTTVATAGSRTTLASSQAVKSVTIKALNTNTGLIYVGNSTVAASNGLQLAAGEAVSMDIANLNTVNLDSAVNGEGVSYAAVG